MRAIDRHQRQKRLERFCDRDAVQRGQELDDLRAWVNRQRNIADSKRREFNSASGKSLPFLRCLGLMSFGGIFVTSYVYWLGLSVAGWGILWLISDLIELNSMKENAEREADTYVWLRDELEELERLDHDISQEKDSFEDDLTNLTTPATTQSIDDPEKIDELMVMKASLALAQQEMERMSTTKEELKKPSQRIKESEAREESLGGKFDDLSEQTTNAAPIKAKQTKMSSKKTSVSAWPFQDKAQSVSNKKEKESKNTTPRKPVLVSYEDYEELSWSDGWNIDPDKTTLSNKNTGEVLKVTDGLGFSEAQGFYLLYNKSRPRKLRVR